MNQYLETLFDTNESICHGSRYETLVAPRDSLTSASEYVALNPLRDRRLDSNVTSFRNLLIESDTLNIDTQRKRMNAIGMPYSAAVFSGGKSIHFIVSLETPCTRREDYDQVVRRVYKALESLDFLCDASNKNPSRFTRNPGHLRADKGQVQELLEVRGRVPNLELETWSKKFAPDLPPARLYHPLSKWQRNPSGRTLNFLQGIVVPPPGEKHRAVLLAALDLSECGASMDECLLKLSRVPCIELDANVRKAVQWAYTRSNSA